MAWMSRRGRREQAAKEGVVAISDCLHGIQAMVIVLGGIPTYWLERRRPDRANSRERVEYRDSSAQDVCAG